MAGYLVGTPRTIFVHFAIASGQPADATAVRLYVKSPTGSTVAYTYGASAIRKPAGTQGYYEFDLVLAASGRWSWRWEGDDVGGTGLPAVAEDRTDCAPSTVRTDLR